MTTGRYAFLDLYRGIIILVMIEGHVVRELLQPMLRATQAFQIHELLHGITGPGFLFGAGITFGIAAQRRWTEYLSFTPVLRKRLRRISLLLALGYMLHLPFFSLWKTLMVTREAGWISFMSFDVLQCIGSSLLILQVLMLIIRKERLFVGAIVVLMLAMVYASPLIWGSESVQGLPRAISMALQGNSGSTYPLFPNSAFLFAGAFASYEFMKFADLGRQAEFVKRLAVAGILLHILGLVLEAIPVEVYPAIDYWQTSPNFFLIKLGGLFLLVSGVWFLEHRLFSRQFSFKARWLLLLGVESLFVYVVHLLAVYGWILNQEFNLSSAWANDFGWGTALGITALLTAVLAFLAWGWNRLKTDHVVLMKGIAWWLGGTFLYEFLTRPY
ncbi:MAG: DUF1624 domain-containing protein [Ignavibacteriales bacterium]|nr:DUF1624 domain-containing protein [Ignavibacteriales bacterium]